MFSTFPSACQAHSALDQPFALYQGTIISRRRLWADVDAVAQRLPDRQYQINLCENRYLFCVHLLAAIVRGQTCLLPPSNQAAIIEEILRDYADAYGVKEQSQPEIDLPWIEARLIETTAESVPLTVDWQRPAVIAFTSGSTGKPKPCPHSLATFKISAEMAVESLGLDGQPKLMLSTTPPQHMYGLETSVFWPLFSRLILHDGRPFFAEDIRQAVQQAPWSAVLASTPTHLRAISHSTAEWHNLAAVISATDNLSVKLAEQIENNLGQPLYEIYGSTETLSFACRQSLRQTLWQPYAGARLMVDGEQAFWLTSPHLPGKALLQDQFELHSDGRFSVLGRHYDMIKISGKRASLAELNRRLGDIDGVDDGFCIVQTTRGEDRITAVIVGNLDREAIRQSLKPYVDEVFLPRKLYQVDNIPRNAAGKLTQAAIDRLMMALQSGE